MKGLVDSTCRGCIYLSQMGHKQQTGWCDYIGHTGHRRPCPAGKGCTVRKTRRQKARDEAQEG